MSCLNNPTMSGNLALWKALNGNSFFCCCKIHKRRKSDSLLLEKVNALVLEFRSRRRSSIVKTNFSKEITRELIISDKIQRTIFFKLDTFQFGVFKINLLPVICLNWFIESNKDIELEESENPIPFFLALF